MAVTATKIQSSINLKYKTGVNANGNDIFKSKKIVNVKVTAADADIFAVGTSIGTLLMYPVSEVQKSDDSTLLNA